MFADSPRAIGPILLGRLDEMSFENLGQIDAGRNFVIHQRGVNHFATFFVQHQFFHHAGTHSLYDAAVYLAQDQARVNHLAHVVTSYHPIDSVLTGLRVNRNFHRLGAKGPLGDRLLALAGFGVEEKQTLGQV